ncbi:MAG TPA: hypothetical protein VG943_03665 [Caulobacterales bacterium]|nr:hypothetical protein [Caulobacterales bacterium]
MKRIVVALALALAACAPPQAPAPRIEEFVTPPQHSTFALCTSDAAWCVKKTDDVDGFIYSFHGRDVATIRDEEGEHSLWKIVRMPRADGAEDALVGDTNTEHAAYSGGGGSATHVTLYALSSSAPAHTPPRAVLTFPLSAALDIRACFSEDDAQARRDACSDQYNFTGDLALDTSTPSAPPRLVLTTEATTYPGRRSRSEDSSAAPPLGPDDLKTVRDERCSYRRVFTANAQGIYMPDQPLPDCSDYLSP